MDIKDWLTIAISLTALLFSGLSLKITVAREGREQKSKQPTCEVYFDRLEGGAATDALLRITNNGSTTLTLLDALLTRRGGQTQSSFPITGKPYAVGIDLDKAGMQFDLERTKLAPGDVYEKRLPMKLMALDPAGGERLPALFEITMRMGGTDDQRSRFRITRMLID